MIDAFGVQKSWDPGKKTKSGSLGVIKDKEWTELGRKHRRASTIGGAVGGGLAGGLLGGALGAGTENPRVAAAGAVGGAALGALSMGGLSRASSRAQFNNTQNRRVVERSLASQAMADSRIRHAMKASKKKK